MEELHDRHAPARFLGDDIVGLRRAGDVRRDSREPTANVVEPFTP